ncbi:MAG: CBS domain-containing protein [Candidatus Heimdallarchaeota archaeon]
MKFDIQLFFEKVKNLKAVDFAIREITPIQANATLLEIFNEIGTSDLPILPVINEKKEYIGIITLRDLLFLFQRRHTSIHEAISLINISSTNIAQELINFNLPIIYDDDSLEVIAETMSKSKSSVLPRATNRKEQISGLIYLSDVFTEIRNLMRKTISESEEKVE